MILRAAGLDSNWYLTYDEHASKHMELMRSVFSNAQQ